MLAEDLLTIGPGDFDPMSGMMIPIKAQDILSWCQMVKIEMLPQDAEFLVYGSRAFCAEFNSVKSSKTGAGVPPYQETSDPKEIDSKLRQFIKRHNDRRSDSRNPNKVYRG